MNQKFYRSFSQLGVYIMKEKRKNADDVTMSFFNSYSLSLAALEARFIKFICIVSHAGSLLCLCGRPPPSLISGFITVQYLANCRPTAPCHTPQTRFCPLSYPCFGAAELLECDACNQNVSRSDGH